MLILKAIGVAIRVWGKKKDTVLLVFMPFGDRLLKHVALIVDAL